MPFAVTWENSIGCNCSVPRRRGVRWITRQDDPSATNFHMLDLSCAAVKTFNKVSSIADERAAMCHTLRSTSGMQGVAYVSLQNNGAKLQRSTHVHAETGGARWATRTQHGKWVNCRMANRGGSGGDHVTNVIVLDRCHLFCRGKKAADETIIVGSTDIGRGLFLSTLLYAGVLRARVVAYRVRARNLGAAAVDRTTAWL